MRIPNVSLALLSVLISLTPLTPALAGPDTPIRAITQPGDPIVAVGDPTNAGFGAPDETNEAVRFAIDGTNSKYFNTSTYDAHYSGSGYYVTPRSGPSIVTGVTIISGNDSPQRDPTTFSLYGSNDSGKNFEPIILRKPLASFAQRFETQQVVFPNTKAYLSYKLVFPTVNGGRDMQVSEATLFGVPSHIQASPITRTVPLPEAPRFDIAGQLARADVTWDSPSVDSRGSMPIGNGDIGLNVWVEPSGDILFYIGKTDSWAGDARNPWGLPKLGRVRVRLTPNPFPAGTSFSQTLKLRESEIVIEGGVASDRTTVTLWVDANNPAIHVDATSGRARSLDVSIDSYRKAAEQASLANIVFPAANGQIAWCYRNPKGKVAELSDRTFGAVIRGNQLAALSDSSLKSTDARAEHHVAIYPLTAQTATPADWLTAASSLAERVSKVPPLTSKQAHRAWWADFWNRSWVCVSGDADADKVTSEWFRQRFVTACAGRGAYPIKFNGSIFNTDYTLHRWDSKTKTQISDEVTADFRNWGGMYWFQNTRPMYWPMLASGDFDMMQPLFSMYRSKLDATKKMVREYYKHDGTYFEETSPFWPTIPNIAPGDKPSYTKHYFTPILELTAMGLDYYAFTGDKAFLRDTLLPIADSGVTFFEQHFGRDAAGKLDLFPDNSIETFWGVRNPAPDIAGLRYVLRGLLDLPPAATTADQRKHWAGVLAIIPELPVSATAAKPTLLPYQEAPDPERRNSENPELYAIYPFRLFGIGKPNLQLGRDTFVARKVHGTQCWRQDPVQAAYLGFTESAQRDVIRNFGAVSKDAQMRFPTFWGPFQDYTPDEDNGGHGLLALQLMLLQSDASKIIVLPAWPADWSASFKLRAPMNTTVEGTVAGGKLTSLTVTPKSRRNDVVTVAADGSLMRL
ncbi:MAG TPA: DUF5703 domain-containing protein [Capsulimonadaceae bacterium]|jgi:hypothetical protein